MRRHDTTAKIVKRAARAGGAMVARVAPQSAMLRDPGAIVRAPSVGD